jgi:ethanolamine utilization protein EutJ
MSPEALLEEAFRTGDETRRDWEGPLRVGVDLGTASVVLTVVDRWGRPVAFEMEEASVVRDGLVVDFAGASAIVRRLKGRLEGRIGEELVASAIALPPGTSERDGAAHRYVVEGSGLEVLAVMDEPTAANHVLGVSDGAVVDIGGGTTGIAAFRDGRVVRVHDEPTGGVHVSLVIAGNRGIPLEEAEALKRDPAMQGELLGVVKPVFQKMGAIVRRSIQGLPMERLYLVGGTCAFGGIDRVLGAEVGIQASIPPHPFLVTPLGIALGCPVRLDWKG